jgi:2-dehydro-3-deoxyphosphooctonate aldolase (KDO 8-P synthase)
MNKQSKHNLVAVKDFFVGHGQPLTIISGPCVIEDEEHTLRCADILKKMLSRLPVQFIFKASYDKANRSSIHSFRGPGPDEGLRILEKVKKEFDVPVLTDIHSPEEAKIAAPICDILQIPAFLCRQTDLIVAAAKTGNVIHAKKGQFMAPWEMGNVVEKIKECGNQKIILADRGTSFGYNNLVSDMRAIPIMKNFGFPVSFDASHSTQFPGGNGTSSGGDRKFIPTLAKAAVASGCDVIFIESHTNPQEAKSDSSTVFPLTELSKLIEVLVALYEIVKNEPKLEL